MSQHDRSFSDREVALVLRRAAEIETSEGSRAGGLSRTDIMDVATLGVSTGEGETS